MTIEDTEELVSAIGETADEASEDQQENSAESMAQLNPHATAVDAELLRKIIEGALLAAGQPLTVARLLELFDPDVAPTKEEILEALQTIESACGERGFELKEVASGWRFQVREGLAPWVNRLWEEKPQKYSRALLETLALIAYRQPITRGDIEEIRGVAVSSHIIKTLMEREWVKVVGHRDVPGRPSLFATTRQFLDYFNIKSLEDLPSLSEIRDLDELNAALNLGGEEEGIGEPDTDTGITDSTAPVDIPEETLEEFVDGEDAFEDAEYAPINHAGQEPQVTEALTDNLSTDEPAVEQSIADEDSSVMTDDVNEDEEYRKD